MLPNPRVEAPSRANKRQVIVYLEVNADTAVKACAQRQGDTQQTFLAKAINHEFERRGLPAPLTVTKLRLFIRRNNTAKPRVHRATALSRRGRSSIAGWFAIPEVTRLNEVCAELGLTVQDIGEAGLSSLVSADLRAEETADSSAR